MADDNYTEGRLKAGNKRLWHISEIVFSFADDVCFAA